MQIKQQQWRDRFISLMVELWWIAAVGALFSSPHNDNHVVPLPHSNLRTSITSTFQTNTHTHTQTEHPATKTQSLPDDQILLSQRQNPSRRRVVIKKGPEPSRSASLNGLSVTDEGKRTHHDYVWGSKRKRRKRKCEEKGKGRCVCVACCTQRGRCNNCWMGGRRSPVYICRAGICSCAPRKRGFYYHHLVTTFTPCCSVFGGIFPLIKLLFRCLASFIVFFNHLCLYFLFSFQPYCDGILFFTHCSLFLLNKGLIETKQMWAACVLDSGVVIAS